MKLSGNAIWFFHAWALVTKLANVKPIDFVVKMDAASVIPFFCMVMRRNPTLERKLTTTIRLHTMRMQYSQQTSVVGICRLLPTPRRVGTLHLRQWLFVTLNLRSHLWTRALENSWMSKGTHSHLLLLTLTEQKKIASEKVGIKVTTLKESETRMFHLHPTMYLGNKIYE